MSSAVSESCVACWTTCPDEKVAEGLATTLLSERLCACVNIIPGVTSMYWWDNKVNKDQEFLLMIKTTKSNQEKLIEHIKQEHPYDVPEVICVDIDHGNNDYLDWVKKATSPTKD